MFFVAHHLIFNQTRWFCNFSVHLAISELQHDKLDPTGTWVWKTKFFFSDHNCGDVIVTTVMQQRQRHTWQLAHNTWQCLLQTAKKRMSDSFNDKTKVELFCITLWQLIIYSIKQFLTNENYLLGCCPCGWLVVAPSSFSSYSFFFLLFLLSPPDLKSKVYSISWLNSLPFQGSFSLLHSFASLVW